MMEEIFFAKLEQQIGLKIFETFFKIQLLQDLLTDRLEGFKTNLELFSWGFCNCNVSF